MDPAPIKPATPVYASTLAKPAAGTNDISELFGSTGKTRTSGDSLGEFRELMAVMLLGVTMSGMNASGTSEGGLAGMGTNELMAPLMLSLFEKLLAKEVEDGSAADETGSAALAARSTPSPTGLPIKGRLTQGARAGHIALDFGAPVGTPVKSTMDGKVVYAGWNDEGYGNLVIVENGPYRTYYGHLSKIPVQYGQQVEAGSTIGLSGNTGNSTGPHLHYEVRKHGQHLDPLDFTLV
jgi:murein DD-endopeptidase MepM/ murein hydrolase activator NlpD